MVDAKKLPQVPETILKRRKDRAARIAKNSANKAKTLVVSSLDIA